MKKLFFALCFLPLLAFSGKERIYINKSAAKPAEREAILILPGFGSRMQGTAKIAEFFFNRDYDVFLPDYISRQSIQGCTDNLDNFIIKYKLLSYKKLHVFAYIVGSWTINSWIGQHPENNIASIVYDRSPLQERAPYALVKDMPLIIRMVSGNIMSEFAKTPYPTLQNDKIRKGILIECKSTKLIRKHKKSALLPGPVTWNISALKQNADDLCYVPLNHDQMYRCFDIIGNEILHFFSASKFSDSANRKIPDENKILEDLN